MLAITKPYLYPLVHIKVFVPVFAPRPHVGDNARMDPKLPLKCRDVSWPSPPTPSSKSFFQNDRPEPHPLNDNKRYTHPEISKISFYYNII